MADGIFHKTDGHNTVPSQKFQHPDITADGSERAHVHLSRLETLWVNTGTLCNIECAHCYIKSSPTNDTLVYLREDELAPYLAEAKTMGAHEIGFTGGEPFMNPDALAMIEAALRQGFDVLVLTNAMRPMMRERVKSALIALKQTYGDKLRLRISLDHFDPALHDEERGQGSFDIARDGLAWLCANKFSLSIAARLRWGDDEKTMRDGFAAFLATLNAQIDPYAPEDLILFPEMDETSDIPEITTECWDILKVSPDAMMCATSRMLVKRKGASEPVVLACTLLAYDQAFELGTTLNDASTPVKLNHPHCAQFCVLGGASCSG